MTDALAIILCIILLAALIVCAAIFGAASGAASDHGRHQMTDHEKHVLAVLKARRGILSNILRENKCTPKDRPYYKGKVDGYDQAIDLLHEAAEGLAVELEIPDTK